MTTVAVLGSTGAAGSRVVARLEGRDVAVVGLSRSSGVDLVTGHGLSAALEGIDVVVDASNPTPAAGDSDVMTSLTTAARNVVGACASQGIQRLVTLTIAGAKNPEVENLPYFMAKRAVQQVVLNGPVPATIVKSTHFHEFAMSPAAVVVRAHEVVVEDWLIQPIAADTVADVLVEAALSQTRTPRTITGPQVVRLPELTSRLLALSGDHRSVRAAEPALSVLAAGALLAPDQAMILGPDVDTWLDTVRPDTVLGPVADGSAGQPATPGMPELTHI